MNDSGFDDERLASERRRGNTYKLFSELLRQPDEELVALLEEVEGAELAVDPAELRTAGTDLQTMRVDHAKLLVGPFELDAPPYESTYREKDRRVMTEATKAVQSTYRQEGFDVDIDEPADHVVPELEFMYVLVLREVAALSSGNGSEAGDYIQKQAEFFSAHLGRWADEFASKVKQHAETEFYEQLGAALERFLESERPLLSGRVDRLDDGEDLSTVIAVTPLTEE